MKLALPASAHRTALRVAQALRLAWWRIRRPTIRGCNAIVRNGAGEVLLVRHSYQTPEKWMLPGGGPARGESIEDAAVREVLEETGCRIVYPRHMGNDTVAISGATNVIALVSARTDDTPVADGREILEAGFFAPNHLPSTISEPARARIERCLRND